MVRWSWRRHSCLPRQDSSWRSRSGENLPAATHYFRMRDFHRRLPHQYRQGKWLFVTWHLHGSLPHVKYPPPNKLSSDAAFVWMDRYLDSTRTGPRYLAQDPSRRLWWRLCSMAYSWVTMDWEPKNYAILANHVYVLLLPKISPSRLLQSQARTGVQC